MFKKLYIMILAALVSVPILAQSDRLSDIPYGPKQGNAQIDLLFGTSSFFNSSSWDGFSYLLPSDVQPSGYIEDEGLAGNEMRYYFNLGDLNQNTVTNMVGVRASYFIFENWDISAMFAMNINLTPKKDYVEGDYTIAEMPIPNYKSITGESNHLFTGELGTNYRFKVRNERISPYLGVFGGFQMARVETTYPYTGETISGDPIELYRNDYRAGQEYAIRAGIMAGIEFAVAPGLVLGIEVSPAAYQYSVVDIHPTGLTPFRADNHSIKILSQPRLRLGIRF